MSAARPRTSISLVKKSASSLPRGLGSSSSGNAMSFDFGVLECLWLMSIEEALTSIKLGRGERLYAIAF